MARRRCGKCGKTGHNRRTCSSKKKSSSKKKTVRKKTSKKRATKQPRTKGEWHGQNISAKHLKKLADKDFTYVSVYIFDKDDPNYDVPHKFVLWLAKPRSEVEKRAKKFIKRVYGKNYKFSTYPRNYVRKAKDLAALGLHEDASNSEINEVFEAYKEQNEERRRRIAEREAEIEARNRQEQEAGIHEDMESMRALEQYTGTYIGDMGGAGLPMYRDVGGFVHLAPSWMTKYPIGQKFRNGKPVSSLRGGRRRRPRRRWNPAVDSPGNFRPVTTAQSKQFLDAMKREGIASARGLRTLAYPSARDRRLDEIRFREAKHNWDAYESQMAAHLADPSVPRPIMTYPTGEDYGDFMPVSEEQSRNYLRGFYTRQRDRLDRGEGLQSVTEYPFKPRYDEAVEILGRDEADRMAENVFGRHDYELLDFKDQRFAMPFRRRHRRKRRRRNPFRNRYRRNPVWF